MQNMLDAALFYLEKLKWAVIPIAPGTKDHPLVKWTDYQTRLPTHDEVVFWWSKTPTANIAAITGKISNLFVVDHDKYKPEYDAEKALQYFSDTLETPIARSPRGGEHQYYRYPLVSIPTTKAAILPATDIRGEGGMIVLPPSVNGNGRKYEWIVKPTEVSLSLVPDAFIKLIINNIYKYNRDDVGFVGCATNFLKRGTRDEDLFHIMNCLAKGGYKKDLAEKLSEIIAEKCDPPLDFNEAREKVKSAYERKIRSEQGITQLVRDYISTQESNIYLTETNETLQFQQNQQRAACQMAFTRLCKEGLIVKVARGAYKKVERDCADIDLWSDQIAPLDIKYPLGVHELMVTHPKNIIILAGEANAGKTAYLLNFAQMNAGRNHEIIYFSSEMGAIELKSRLIKFGLPMHEWKKIIWKERAADFSPMIRPNAINIIDFLEIHTDFFKIGLLIKEIFDKLDKGIAIIALQKNKGRDEGLGGMRSLEKARLYMAMEPGKLKIVKAKNWRNNEINPNGLVRRYRLGGGCNFKADGDWAKE